MKALGYCGGVLGMVGLLWGTIILEMGLTMALIGAIMMVLAMVFIED